jgi:hypothetical protein
MATSTVTNLPAQYIQDLGKDYGTQLAGLTSVPLNTDMYAPQVAGQDAMQQQAYNLTSSGIGSYEPYMTQANAYSGPQGYQSFMSPYQQDVIDASLSEFDQQAAKGMTGIGQNAAKSGNLGGGREGVQRAEYQSNSDMQRAILQAGMLQQGFGQAQTQANTAFGQQRNLGQQVQQQQTADVNQLGLLGGLQQAQTQAGLTATQEGNRLRAMEPYERMGQYGSGVMGLISGMGNQYQSQVTPNPTPLQTALGTASVLGGIFNPRSNNN